MTQAPAPAPHAALLYQEDAQLGHGVAALAAEVLACGSAAFLIATQAHRDAICAGMNALGVAWELAIREQRLVFADADALFQKTMASGAPDLRALWVGYDEVLAGMAPCARDGLLVWGEMIDLLAAAGHWRATEQLEERWVELTRTRPIRLACSYRVDPFDVEAYSEALPRICALHDELRPFGDEASASRAIEAAETGVLGAGLAAQLYALAAEPRSRPRMPKAQRRLFWLARHMPATAAKIMIRARRAASRPLTTADPWTA